MSPHDCATRWADTAREMKGGHQMGTYQPTHLGTLRCCSCDILFAMPQRMVEARQRDGALFYCPCGHPQSWRDTEADGLRKRLASAEARALHEQDQRRAAERSNAALRGVVTRTKRRIGNGVCPCCNRHFANVERHMSAKHPDYAAAGE